MSRWIRLDTTWSSSTWLSNLNAPARLCWVELLCYVKAHGVAGRAKALPTNRAAALWGVTRNIVTEMLTAAMADSAVEEVAGEWVITGWGSFQRDNTAAERMARYRQRQQGLSDDDEPTPKDDKRNVTRNDRNVTAYKDKDSIQEEPPIDPPLGEKRKKPAKPLPDSWTPTASHQKKADELGVDVSEEADAFRDLHRSKDNRYADWDLTFHTWLRNTQKFGGNGKRRSRADNGPPMPSLRGFDPYYGEKPPEDAGGAP